MFFTHKDIPLFAYLTVENINFGMYYLFLYRISLRLDIYLMLSVSAFIFPLIIYADLIIHIKRDVTRSEGLELFPMEK